VSSERNSRAPPRSTHLSVSGAPTPRTASDGSWRAGRTTVEPLPTDHTIQFEVGTSSRSRADLADARALFLSCPQRFTTTASDDDKKTYAHSLQFAPSSNLDLPRSEARE
jgi:hypothetical protein